MQPTGKSQHNLDYAQEWISFLKRRNLILSIIWPILLAFVIFLSVFVVYFYQLDQTTKLSLASEIENNHALEEAKQTLQAEIAALTTANSELNSELESLVNAREELSVLNNDSTSRLNITSQMVDNLNQLVSELKTEREDLTAKLEDSLIAIAQLQKQHQQTIKQITKEKSETVDELNKQLESRKTAYQALANRQQEMREEMDRLRGITNTKDKQIENLKGDQQKLESVVNDKNAEINRHKQTITNLEKKYTELENKLNVLVSPVGSKETKQQGNNAVSNLQTDASKKVTGLEEIKKPVVVRKSNEEVQQEKFDHNQISILP